jgi:hypothetical protein
MLRPALLASSAVQLLIKLYGEPDDYCTGAANEAQLALARAKYHYSEPNDVRDVIDKKLQAYGWCFGERGQTQLPDEMASLQRELVHRRRVTVKLTLSLPMRRIAVYPAPWNAPAFDKDESGRWHHPTP